MAIGKAPQDLTLGYCSRPEEVDPLRNIVGADLMTNPFNKEDRGEGEGMKEWRNPHMSLDFT